MAVREIKLSTNVSYVYYSHSLENNSENSNWIFWMQLTSKNLDFTAIHLPTLYDYRASKGNVIHIYYRKYESLYAHFPLRMHIYFPKTSINLTFYQFNSSSVWFIFLLCIPLEWDCKASFPFNNFFSLKCICIVFGDLWGKGRIICLAWFSNSLDAAL